MKYSYLHDLPAVNQMSVGGTQAGRLQKSHVISLDAIYDLFPKWSLGAKYAFRKSQVAERAQPQEFRKLYGVQAKTTQTDSLIAVYRHLGNNLKLGIGYQNGNVSDNITDLTYAGQGIFINLVVKF